MFRKRTHQSAFCISPKRVRHKRHSAVFYILKSNMATPSAALLERLDKQGIPKSKRKLQKHLRSAGLAYISRTGKLIPAKKVAGKFEHKFLNHILTNFVSRSVRFFLCVCVFNCLHFTSCICGKHLTSRNCISNRASLHC